MRFVVVAGVPLTLANIFAQDREKRLAEGKRHIIWSPVQEAIPSYKKYYVDRLQGLFLKSLREYLPERELSNGEYIKSTAVLIYVNYSNDISGVDTLVRSFFPALFSLPIPELIATRLINQPRSRLEREANVLVENIRRKIRVAEKILPALEKELTSRANKTCLLLPQAQFRSEKLGSFYTKLQAELLRTPEAFACVREEVRKFEQSGLDQVKEGDTSSFVDDRHLIFRSPSKNRHGFMRYSSSHGHPASCFTRSRFRLGAAYDPRFHYDCISKKGVLASDWRSCHQQEFRLPDGREHINIAPNDNVR